MSLSFTPRDLYGGAITVHLPTSLVDASNLRQIPDHQEVFLSDKTLTSIIFEINEYQQPPPTTSNDTNATSSPDETAAHYHLTDVIDPPDHLSPSGITSTPVHLSRPSLSGYPAIQSTATIISPELDRSRKTTLPLTWQTSPAQKEQQTAALQLLVRMKEHATDLCVRINVPLKELGDVQSEAAQMEASHASEIMRGIVETLDVKDFGLFGAEA